MIYKPKHKMNDGDMVAGVVYAAAAEELIRGQFDVMGEEGGKPRQPFVSGYMVEVDDASECDVEAAWEGQVEMDDGQWGLRGGVDDVEDDKGCECSYFCRGKIDETKQIQARKGATGVSEWSQVDLDRKTVLCAKRQLDELELRELAAINRRLGYDVTG